MGKLIVERALTERKVAAKHFVCGDLARDPDLPGITLMKSEYTSSYDALFIELNGPRAGSLRSYKDNSLLVPVTGTLHCKDE